MKNLKKLLLFILFTGSLGIYLTSCEKSNPIVENQINVTSEISDREGLVPEDEIDKFVLDWISEHKTAFDWDNAPDNMLYSALMYGDSILTIDFNISESTDKREFYRKNRRLPAEWVELRESIVDYVLVEEKSYRRNGKIAAKDLLPFPIDDRLAVINIKVTNPSTISNLRRKYHVKLDPPGYLPPSLSRRAGVWPPLTGSPTIGCNPDAEAIDIADYDLTINGTRVSWNYINHRIPNAWACTQGKNVEVCVIDTGVSDNQPHLDQSNFDPHFPPSGRVINKHVELRNLEGPCLSLEGAPVEDWLCLPYPRHDECGHGTAMAGVVGAPFILDSSIGVAYKSDLYTIKASHDVYINARDELMGTRDAIMTAADRAQTKIISMSLGRRTANGDITNALMYADANDKLIFAAAGTSTLATSPFVSVIFPANLPFVHAVTGENITGSRCSDCHYGTEVDFTAVMERGSILSGYTGPITLASDPGMKYTGGSSCATATVAGIAALVGSKYPNESANSIRNRLIFASSNYDFTAPNQGRSNTIGWGHIDAYTAVNECN